jgi:hypothetical protein
MEWPCVWQMHDVFGNLEDAGEVAERFKAAVLKTVEGQPSGGSNPSLSAISIVCASLFGVTFSSSFNPPLPARGGQP